MNKEEVITLLRNAKQAHKRWLENAISLIEGLPLEDGQVPVNSTDCIFGQWYYGEGQNLKSMAVFREIEEPHDILHKIYREIFVMIFEQTKPSLLNRLFGLSHKVSKEKKIAAKSRLSALEYQSKIIMKKLDDLENMIMAMAPQQFESYFLKKI